MVRRPIGQRTGQGAAHRTGKVRLARLTDLSALGDLSRLSHGIDERADTPVRHLGLPVSSSQISVFSFFRLPLGAFLPHDLLYVYEDDHKLAGLLRVERDTHRDEWTIVELDAIDHGDAGDIRFRLLQHLMRDGGRRGAHRFHVACADQGGNVELFMQVGFARYGEERILLRPQELPLPPPTPAARAESQGIRAAQPLDALPLSRLYASATPGPVARLEAYRLPDWERQGTQWRIPRSSLTPVLRFADVEAYVQESAPDPGAPLSAFLQVGVAKEDHPHYVRVVSLPDHDPSALIEFGLGVIAEQRGRGGPDAGSRGPNGVLSPVRTYESPLDRRFEQFDFAPVATVSLLLKETVVRVAEPALVPAIR
ncbi:hypothetical protein BH20CHL6_BH20CHL6_15430 [soil metagenome]